MKILHLNIEKAKYREKIENLITSEQPDVVSFCEIYEVDAKDFSDRYGYEYVFSPLYQSKRNNQIEGQALFSKKPIETSGDFRYVESSSEELPVADSAVEKNGQRPEFRWEYHYSVLVAHLANGLTVTTTHFPVVDYKPIDDAKGWSINTEDVERAQAAFSNMINVVEELPRPLVFMGDLNNPRGEGMYEKLSERLVDMVPMELTSSLDPKLHRAKGLELMVDAFMVTPDIKAEKVRVVEGVSDHVAFIGKVWV